MQICPSILENAAEDYLKLISKLSLSFHSFQLDFADGLYVENKTVSIFDFVKEFTSNKFTKSITLQTLKALNFDFHLMVKDYEECLEEIAILKDYINIKNVLIHFNLSPKISELNSKYLFTIGLVVSPQDQIKDLGRDYRLMEIPCLQIMSVVPGAQGKPFMPETLNKIEQLRNMGYRNNIYLDGGINNQTLPTIASQKNQPDVLCPGSYLTKAPAEDLANRINYLLSFK